MTFIVPSGETESIDGELTNGPAYIDGTLTLDGTLNLAPPPLARTESFQIDESRRSDFTVSGRGD